MGQSTTLKVTQRVSENTPQSLTLEGEWAELTVPPVRWRGWTWEDEIPRDKNGQTWLSIRKIHVYIYIIDFLQKWVWKCTGIQTLCPGWKCWFKLKELSQNREHEVVQLNRFSEHSRMGRGLNNIYFLLKDPSVIWSCYCWMSLRILWILRIIIQPCVDSSWSSLGTLCVSIMLSSIFCTRRCACLGRSQHHRIVWVGRDHKDLVPNPCHGQETRWQPRCQNPIIFFLFFFFLHGNNRII